jgi:hypothetical protein
VSPRYPADCPGQPGLRFILTNTVDASSFVLPFMVTNKSAWFNTYVADSGCRVNLLYFMDADNHTALVRDVKFNTGAFDVPPGPPINYPCDAAKYIRILSDGSMVIGFPYGQLMKTGPDAFHPPLTILKMCLWISGHYRVFGIAAPFTSKMFQWPAEPNQRQWIEGRIVFDADEAKWIPSGSKLIGAWGLRKLTTISQVGEVKLLPGALQCDAGS